MSNLLEILKPKSNDELNETIESLDPYDAFKNCIKYGYVEGAKKILHQNKFDKFQINNCFKNAVISYINQNYNYNIISNVNYKIIELFYSFKDIILSSEENLNLIFMGYLNNESEINIFKKFFHEIDNYKNDKTIIDLNKNFNSHFFDLLFKNKKDLILYLINEKNFYISKNVFQDSLFKFSRRPLQKNNINFLFSLGKKKIDDQMIANTILECCKRVNFSKINFFISKMKKQKFNQIISNKILEKSILYKNFKYVQFAISRGANPINNRLISKAILSQNLDIIKILLEKNKPIIHPKKQHTILNTALFSTIEIAQYLFSEINFQTGVIYDILKKGQSNYKQKTIIYNFYTEQLNLKNKNI